MTAAARKAGDATKGAFFNVHKLPNAEVGTPAVAVAANATLHHVNQRQLTRPGPADAAAYRPAPSEAAAAAAIDRASRDALAAEAESERRERREVVREETDFVRTAANETAARAARTKAVPMVGVESAPESASDVVVSSSRLQIPACRPCGGDTCA